MGTIQVQSPGLFTTVQDLGRYGYGPLGVSPSGAADPIALRIGNLLVGNAEGAAGLEMTLLGGTFVFPEGGAIALTGSDFAPALDGSPIPMWSARLVEPGQTLHTGATRSGARCYLAVRGGVAVKPFLGSLSTHVPSGLGGFEGRPLRRGDVIHTGDGATAAPRRARVDAPQPRKILRTTAAPQAGLFSDEAIRCFYKSAYLVTEESNRMGLRLAGPPVETPHSGEMITEGVSLGAIQTPAGGQPIILYIDQQTTGGYPKIANVIAADLASVGQLRPRDEVRFEQVSPATALALIREQERWLAELSSSLE